MDGRLGPPIAAGNRETQHPSLKGEIENVVRINGV